MVLKTSDNKFNTKTKIYLKCDKCGREQRRPYLGYLELKKNKYYVMDYCEKCWNSIKQKTPEAKNKMSIAIRNVFEKHPEIKQKISNSSKGKINLGDSNGMKNPITRKKVSNTRKELMKNPLFRKKISDLTKKAWAEGKFDNVKVGICKWYVYNHSNGKKYKVQGTWELAFIKWLDEQNIDFICHRGKLEYKLNGEKKTYHPDFFIHSWNCYVDIKNNYHYSINIDKFEALKKEGYNIKIIFKEELENLIKIKL